MSSLFGTITFAELRTGHAFVHYENEASTHAAVERANGMLLGKLAIKVEQGNQGGKRDTGDRNDMGDQSYDPPDGPLSSDHPTACPTASPTASSKACTTAHPTAHPMAYPTDYSAANPQASLTFGPTACPMADPAAYPGGLPGWPTWRSGLPSGRRSSGAVGGLCGAC